MNARDDWNKIYFSLIYAFNLSDLDEYKGDHTSRSPLSGVQKDVSGS